MSTALELGQLPLTERIEAMEQLWDSLCREPGYDPSPDWHKAVLAERRKELQQGQVFAWDDVKARLHKQP